MPASKIGMHAHVEVTGAARNADETRSRVAGRSAAALRKQQQEQRDAGSASKSASTILQTQIPPLAAEATGDEV
jgi:hypothetical protein